VTRLRMFLSRLWALLRSRQMDRDIDDEIAGHLSEAKDEYIQQGLSPKTRTMRPCAISGPPDAAFARNICASWVLRMIMGFLSYGIRAKAKRRQANYSFLFMRANGEQLSEITSLIDDGSSAQSWIESSPSHRPRKRWPTSKQDAPRARSSSH